MPLFSINQNSLHKITIYSQNISGGNTKVLKINHTLNTTDYDIVCIQETWFSNKIDDNEIIAGSTFLVNRADRSNFLNHRKTGGGVVTFIRNTFECSIIQHSCKTIIEHIISRIKLGSSFVLLLNIYLPPYRTRNIMINEFQRILNKLHKDYPNDEIIVVGDFNLTNLTWQFNDIDIGYLTCNTENLSNFELRFLQVCASFCLYQMNDSPNQRGAFLDLILCTNINNIKVYQPALHELFDNQTIHHNAVSIQYSYASTRDQNQHRNINTFNIRLKDARNELLTLNFPSLNQDDIDNFTLNDSTQLITKINTFTLILSNLQSKHTSIIKKKAPIKVSRQPWTNSDKFRRLHLNRDKIKAIHLQINNNETKLNLKKANIALMNEYTKLKAKYFDNLIKNRFNDSRDFYKIMKSRKRPSNQLPPAMEHLGLPIYGENRIIAIANHLKSCFTESSMQFSDDVDISLDQISQIYQEHFDEANNNLWVDYINGFELTDVISVINGLDEKKDAGPMNISVKFIKFNCDILAPILLNIFNVILSTGVVPTEWKLSFITPIPKKGSLTSVANYRGISMQSSIPKIFDALLTKKLYSHVDIILSKNQHGFRSNHSTITNLLESTQFLSENLKQGHQIDAVYFDLTKAFDQVDHMVLARKMCQLSIPYSLFITIMQLITKRRYIIKANGSPCNSSFIINSSVPQGSHCGPLLFLILCNDVNSCVNNLGVKILQYADDTKFFKVIRNENDSKQLQEAIDNFSDWIIANKLKINVAKTFHVTYMRKTPPYHIMTQYYIHDERIAKSELVRDLGILFDDKLTFKQHTEDLLARTHKMFGASYRFVRDIHAPQLLTKILTEFIAPIVDYGSIIWGCNKSMITAKLEKIYHSCSRIVTGSPYRTDADNYVDFIQRMKNIGLLTFEQKRQIASCIFGIKILKGLAQTKLQSAFINSLYNSTYPIRDPPIFYIDNRNIPRESPLFFIMNNINTHRSIIDMSNVNITRRRLKEAMKQN